MQHGGAAGYRLHSASAGAVAVMSKLQTFPAVGACGSRTDSDGHGRPDDIAAMWSITHSEWNAELKSRTDCGLVYMVRPAACKSLPWFEVRSQTLTNYVCTMYE